MESAICGACLNDINLTPKTKVLRAHNGFGGERCLGSGCVPSPPPDVCPVCGIRGVYDYEAAVRPHWTNGGPSWPAGLCYGTRELPWQPVLAADGAAGSSAAPGNIGRRSGRPNRIGRQRKLWIAALLIGGCAAVAAVYAGFAATDRIGANSDSHSLSADDQVVGDSASSSGFDVRTTSCAEYDDYSDGERLFAAQSMLTVMLRNEGLRLTDGISNRYVVELNNACAANPSSPVSLAASVAYVQATGG